MLLILLQCDEQQCKVAIVTHKLAVSLCSYTHTCWIATVSHNHTSCIGYSSATSTPELYIPSHDDLISLINHKNINHI